MTMTPLFFLFDISPEASILILLFWGVVFLVLAVRDAGKKSWEKKPSNEWTQKDWQEYLADEQARIDEMFKK